MEKGKLFVTISGVVGSGKSSITFLLKQFLREKGFEVEFDGGFDFENEYDFDQHISKNIDQAIELIKTKNQITFKELQLKRSFKEEQQL